MRSPSNSASGGLVASSPRIGVGAPAPDFTLKRIDGSEVNLASFRGKRPVILVFASYTCDVFRDQQTLIELVYDQFKEHAEFFLVYIREAHPSGGWVIPENELRGISIKDPKSYSQRVAVATTACEELRLKLPCLIDGADDAISDAYLAWPVRIVLMDADGKIAVLSSQNPVSFAPTILKAREWLKKLKV